jgi:hypothetical protein
MTQPIHIINILYGITVPEGAQNFRAVETEQGTKGIFYDTKLATSWIALPPGNWQLICMARDTSEEMAKGIVTTGLNGLYKNYDTWIDMSGFEDYDKAVDSLRSLLTSHGLNPETTLLIQTVG